ncbi:hypothetical protein KIN20_021186 [Parelaphostrongylus tenuis]|uniref:Uncharacterized protein n=1 Tax=Parelaphostrongylus tenuis TaxID=148309 RepID=A0AAD5MTT0_PARTN|nr:hypothetical protein KIN20_021186 [Parelaphostrongylus tenuis]
MEDLIQRFVFGRTKEELNVLLAITRQNTVPLKNEVSIDNEDEDHSDNKRLLAVDSIRRNLEEKGNFETLTE